MKVYIFYGRMNPFTRGHEAAIQHIINAANRNGAKPIVVVSHSMNTSKNPLTVNEKKELIGKSFPGLNVRSTSKNAPTIIPIVEGLRKLGHTNFTMFLGSNRMKSFNFVKNVKKVQFGSNRKEGEGVSGTAARTAALRGNFNTFKSLMSPKLNKNTLGRTMNTITSRLAPAKKKIRENSPPPTSRRGASARKRK
jgi:hypothetical protein